MLEGGEDPRFIARRMVILASEDVGNADPRALEVAVAAAHAVEHVGHAGGRSSRSRRPRSTCRWRRSPTPSSARSAPRAGTSATTAPSRRRPTCAPAPTPARRSSAAARATTTRTRRPGARLAAGAAARRTSRGAASTSPARPRPSWRGAWRRSAARGGATCDVDHTQRVLHRERTFGCDPDRTMPLSRDPGAPAVALLRAAARARACAFASRGAPTCPASARCSAQRGIDGQPSSSSSASCATTRASAW